jgi:hypothetical protein
MTVAGYSTRARLISFEFNTEQAYIIEAGDGYFQFYRNNGRIEDPPGTPVAIASPYGAGELPLLRWVQSADVLYLAHPYHPPAKLTRASDISWTYTVITFTAAPAEWTGSSYPGVVAFYEERLWWGGSPNNPQTLWASKTGAFENLTTGTAADDALKFTIQDGQVNTIRWLVPLRRLALDAFAQRGCEPCGLPLPLKGRRRGVVIQKTAQRSHNGGGFCLGGCWTADFDLGLLLRH